MSILIDKLLQDYSNTQVKINEKWYIAKSMSYLTFKGKIKDCIKILKNKAIAVHFKEDERK